jgi:protein subunit release factor B
MTNAVVSTEKVMALKEKMKRLGIEDKDIEEKFVRCQGRGGQKLNKTSACVYLRHLPTGIEVKCQETRSQTTNRFLARRILTEKIENSLLGNASPESKKIEKIRRQKKHRKRLAKKKLESA